MANSDLEAFIERLKTDDALRQRVTDAETVAGRDVLKLRRQMEGIAEANLTALSRIAEEAGYDLADAVQRPDEIQVTPSALEMESANCWLTCCIWQTSEWTTEPFSLTGTGGPP